MSLSERDNDGIKYFMYFISQDNTICPYIDTDIRKLIWYYAHQLPYIMKLNICNNSFVKLHIYI